MDDFWLAVDDFLRFVDDFFAFVDGFLPSKDDFSHNHCRVIETRQMSKTMAQAALALTAYIPKELREL